ncbi:DsrE family protein [Ectothiorhodospira lacustris]|uniref:DsrE family protein n=1 Tax=Ectothiorhodospira lacustris TaxID=2899127 RepID=UPI001EE8765C|nr:DsrE family protein [Ectothiorhodospira lacustris]MCG5499573.1 DsrE family protein [Ectothiorhodospira lacustris]MCG5508733.1 DsrE family protein [Ectothiorhodospira lacustris]MCG5520524.1 DsrE family protein [Ectothiorhodospira lacustris]
MVQTPSATPDDVEADQTVVFIMTSGPSSPARCATPFYLGSVLAAMDARVHIFFTMEGVRLMQTGVAESLCAMPGGRRIIEFIRDAKRAGVVLHVCEPAMPGYDMDPDADLIPEVDHVARASDLADLVLDCDKLITF